MIQKYHHLWRSLKSQVCIFQNLPYRRPERLLRRQVSCDLNFADVMMIAIQCKTHIDEILFHIWFHTPTLKESTQSDLIVVVCWNHGLFYCIDGIVVGLFQFRKGGRFAFSFLLLL